MINSIFLLSTFYMILYLMSQHWFILISTNYSLPFRPIILCYFVRLFIAISSDNIEVFPGFSVTECSNIFHYVHWTTLYSVYLILYRLLYAFKRLIKTTNRSRQNQDVMTSSFYTANSRTFTKVYRRKH